MTMDLLGHKFNDFTIEDQSSIRKILNQSDNHLYMYTFPSLFSWSKVHNYKWSLVDNDTLLIASFNEDSRRIDVFEPKGAFTTKQQEKLLFTISQLPYSIRLTDISSQFLDSYKSFASNFKCEYFRGGANYIYLANDLATMEGALLRKKRQHIRIFKQKYNARVETINLNSVQNCKGVLDEYNLSVDLNDYNYQSENIANIKTIENFEALKQKGLIIFVDDKPVAFSIYERLSDSVAVVRFAKALRTYNGLYQFTYQETARQIAGEGYKYVNLEDDLDIEGLRQAKLSYRPIQLWPNYQLEYIRGE